MFRKTSLTNVIAILLCILVISIPVVYAGQLRTDTNTMDVPDRGVTYTDTPGEENINDKSSETKGGYLFPGLASTMAAILAAAGITYIAIGAAVIAGGYIIYRVGDKIWTYYKAYSYTTLSSHGYGHINDFPNIWKKPPSKKDFEKKCKENMNSRSVERYIQKDGRSIAYNPSTKMVTVGEVDGKTIVTCYKDKDISSKTRGNNPVWKRIK